MTKQESFTKHEHRVLPNFRQQINRAESTEDVKKFFVYTIKDLFEDIFEGEMDFEYEDFKLIPSSDPYYKLSDRVLSSNTFNTLWNDSDLSRVINRLAKSAANRYQHLKKGPEKTDSKIRM